MILRTLLATAITLAATAAGTAALAADLPDQVNPAAADAQAGAPAGAAQPERGALERSVVAPPKPSVETNVQPGQQRFHKHERVSEVLKARKLAGRSDRVVAEPDTDATSNETPRSSR